MRWYARFGGSSSAVNHTSLERVAIDRDGNVFVGGFSGDIGNAASGDAFVMKLDAAGHELWRRTMKSAGWDRVDGVELDSLGNVVVSGAFIGYAAGVGQIPPGPIQIGDKTLSAAGTHPYYVAKYSTAGTLIWAIVRDQDNAGPSLAVDPHDGIYLVGGLPPRIERLQATGTSVWNKPIPAGTPFVADLTTAADDSLLLTGTVSGSVDFGGGELPGVGDDVFVARVDAQGNHRSSRRFSTDSLQRGRAISVISSELVFLAGSYEFQANFGNTPLSASVGNTDMFVTSVPLVAGK
ncbi:MAG: hypothetical protein QM756_05965 [Polyangiaceae bacterium]